MPHIKIESSRPAGNFSREVVRTYIDGKEISDIRSIDVHFRHDAIASVDMTMFPTEDFVLEGDIRLNVQVVPPLGCHIVGEQVAPNKWRYTTVRNQPDLRSGD